jgi:hypothetical protein
MFHLPISNLAVTLRPPGGAEELLLREAVRRDRPLALELVRRLSSVPEAAELTVHDFEALLLYLHALVFGGTIMADAACVCGQRVDITFRTDEYLAHHVPRKLRGVSQASEPGWFTINDDTVKFRLPTIGDQIAVAAVPKPVEALAARCIRPPRLSARLERIMEALSPPLSGAVEGICPQCHTRRELFLDVPSFVLHELGTQAALIYEDVHLLASQYHWAEEYILALPRERRQKYVEMIRIERGVN